MTIPLPPNNVTGTKTCRTVAFLDVLGFKDKVERMSLDELAQKYEDLICNSDALNRPANFDNTTPTLFADHPRDIPWCIRYVFSDSIILIALNESEASCFKLLVYCWRLTQMCIASGMHVRGAITHGEMYLNPSRGIVLGKALTHAYELEQQQEWIGAAIDASVEDAYPNLFKNIREIHILSSPFFRYDVPLKGGKSLNLHTINWRWNLVVEKGTRSLFPATTVADVMVKINNTLEYARAIVNSGRLYVSNQEQLPIELRSMWTGESFPPFGHGDDL
jgi:hypothetical protein